TRFAMLATGLIVLVIALSVQGEIFWITYFAGPVFASSWGFVAFMSIWSSRITEGGAFWGIIAGFVGNVITNLITLVGGVNLPVYLDPILVGAVVSFFVILVVSSRGVVTEEEHHFRASLHVNPKSEYQPGKLTYTLMWPKFMIIIGIATSLLMIVLWAVPYHQALGKGTILMTGEFFFSLVYGGFLVLAGIISWWGILKYYRER
ncbi:MAG: sodium:solute symporter family protein, partial [Pseudomonadota bacterium]